MVVHMPQDVADIDTLAEFYLEIQRDIAAVVQEEGDTNAGIDPVVRRARRVHRRHDVACDESGLALPDVGVEQ